MTRNRERQPHKQAEIKRLGSVKAMPGDFYCRYLTWIPAISMRISPHLSRLALLLLLLTCKPESLADELSESQIKAAYLYNFAKFVEWPAQALPAGADILLCVVGNNVLDDEINALDQRKIGERLLRVVLTDYADPSLNHCHLLFIGSSEQARFLVTLKVLGNAPVLTLSDIDDFAEKGGGIGLLYRDNKVVFEVNLEAIRNGQLHLPSQLLNIASYVYGR